MNQRTIADFTYGVNFTALAAAAAATTTLTIQNDADFVVSGLKYMADIAGAAQTDSTRVIPLATVSIVNGAYDKLLSNVAVQIDTMFGGAAPNYLSKPMRLPANSFLTITVTNYSAATTYANLRLDFIGYKVY